MSMQVWVCKKEETSTRSRFKIQDSIQHLPARPAIILRSGTLYLFLFNLSVHLSSVCPSVLCLSVRPSVKFVFQVFFKYFLKNLCSNFLNNLCSNFLVQISWYFLNNLYSNFLVQISWFKFLGSNFLVQISGFKFLGIFSTTCIQISWYFLKFLKFHILKKFVYLFSSCIC